MTILASALSHNLFAMGIPIGEKVARTLGVYLGLVALLRVAGKRDLAQLNSFDLVVLLLLSNVVQNAVIGNDNSLWGGLLGAVVLVAANSVVVRAAARSASFVRVVEGDETLLVTDGVVHESALHELGLRAADVVTAVRHQGASTMAQVHRAVLTPSGHIEVTLRSEDENATRGDLERVEAGLGAKLDSVLAALANPNLP